MLQRGVVRSRTEAMAWVHTDLGAPSDTARVRRELRQAAWSFWRRHKESLPAPPAALPPCPVFRDSTGQASVDRKGDC
jgi:hypothetical protein